MLIRHLQFTRPLELHTIQEQVLMYYYQVWERSYIFLLTKVSITYCAQIDLYFFFMESFVTITSKVSKSIFEKYHIIVRQIASFHRANTIKLILKQKNDGFIPTSRLIDLYHNL